MIFWILSSGNLCLINHLKLFWPYTASTASNVQTCKKIFGKKSLNVHTVKQFLNFFFQGFLEFLLCYFTLNFNSMQIFIHLVFCHFLLLEFLFLSFFYSKKPSAFWQFVLEAVEAAWGQKSIKWLIRHKFPLLRTATSLISWHKIQNWGHTRSLKCLKTSPMTLY